MTTTIIKGVEFAVITVDEANEHGYAIDDLGEPVYLASHDLGAAVISWTGDYWVCDLEAVDGQLGVGVGDTPEQALGEAVDSACTAAVADYSEQCVEDSVNCAALDVYHTLRDEQPLDDGFDDELFEVIWCACLSELERSMAVRLSRTMGAVEAMQVIRDQLVDVLLVYEGDEHEAMQRIVGYMREA